MRAPPALSVVGWSDAGKTTLVERLVPELRALGLRVGVVKHSSDKHPLHRAGSDTGRFEHAGAELVAFATPAGIQVTVRQQPAEALLALLGRFADMVDVVLVEGWKDGPLPKVEVWREGHGALLAATRSDVLAVVTDAPRLPEGAPEGLRRFGTQQARELAELIARLTREQAHEP
ncbi:MAG TPA: molybdopterin-guanine dinucleotide biosynthesis protein B [Myxococcaceae bacterium]|nr:molybdopterin-guanine dinucleotide biosynthesis protein B [Myxococcaceae bacterium]